MIGVIRRRVGSDSPEAGFTLIELLVTMVMGVIVMGAVAALLITAVKAQPEISAKSQNISTARWVLERLTREIRNGIAVDPERATPSEVSFRTYVRSATCAGGTAASSAPAIECQVTYVCTSTLCTRTQSAPGVYMGTPITIFSGIDDANVFSYTPSAADPTYIKITLQFPNPEGGGGDLTVSDGASMRNATLGN